MSSDFMGGAVGLLNPTWTCGIGRCTWRGNTRSGRGAISRSVDFLRRWAVSLAKAVTNGSRTLLGGPVGRWSKLPMGTPDLWRVLTPTIAFDFLLPRRNRTSAFQCDRKSNANKVDDVCEPSATLRRLKATAARRL